MTFSPVGDCSFLFSSESHKELKIKPNDVDLRDKHELSVLDSRCESLAGVSGAVPGDAVQHIQTLHNSAPVLLTHFGPKFVKSHVVGVILGGLG
jgi:hypothetical protein